MHGRKFANITVRPSYVPGTLYSMYIFLSPQKNERSLSGPTQGGPQACPLSSPPPVVCASSAPHFSWGPLHLAMPLSGPLPLHSCSGVDFCTSCGFSTTVFSGKLYWQVCLRGNHLSADSQALGTHGPLTLSNFSSFNSSSPIVHI